MDIEEDYSKERTKVKNQRRNYTMSEKQLVIKIMRNQEIYERQQGNLIYHLVFWLAG